MKDGEENDWEQDQNERLDVKEYQREEQIMTTVFDQEECEELLRELWPRQALVKAQS